MLIGEAKFMSLKALLSIKKCLYSHSFCEYLQIVHALKSRVNRKRGKAAIAQPTFLPFRVHNVFQIQFFK